MLAGTAPHKGERLRDFIDIFIAPRRAFDAIRPDLPIYRPMMLLAVAAVLTGLAFAVSVDALAFVEEILAEWQEPRPAKESMVRVVNVVIALVPAFAAVYVLLTLLAFGLCLWIVGKLLRDGSDFRASMSLACWASVPGIVHSLAAIVAILLVHEEPSSFMEVILASATYPLNLGELGMDETWLGGVPSFFNLTDFWIMALVAIGYQRWYRTPLAQAIAVAIIPFALLTIIVFAALPFAADPEQPSQPGL